MFLKAALPSEFRSVRRVLVLRRGALGDTVVALPCFHLLRRCFAQAEIALLTVKPSAAGEAPVMDVLAGSGLVDKVFSYPRGMRSVAGFYHLLRSLRDWKPDVAVYLAEPASSLAVRRDAWFLALSGVKLVLGVPLSRDLMHHKPAGEQGLVESEAQRLARCLAPLGDARLNRLSSWDLHLGRDEINTARGWLKDWSGQPAYLGFGVGVKTANKDWGVQHWRKVLEEVSAHYPQLGLLLVGSKQDKLRAAELATVWQGPKLNLCGELTPRGSAVVLGGAQLYIGHDSGPMHLAAIMGVPTVCLFARTAPPGAWFPRGEGHQSLYPQGSKQALRDILPQRVIDAICNALNATTTHRMK